MGAQVGLVPLAEKHLDATFQWVNDPAMMRLLGRTAPVEPDEHQRWFLRLHTRTDCRYFAVETTDSGQHVGNVWLWDINAADRKSEVRVLFGDEASRGRVVGLFRLAFSNPAVVDARVGNEPVYLILAMTADKVLRMKPQNLVTGLPVKQLEAAS